MKALLINSQTRTITEVSYTGKLDDAYRLLNCAMIEAPVSFSNGDTMYCDEEAWLNVSEDDDLHGFMLPGWSYSILGNALIVGTSDEGEDVACKSEVKDFANTIWRDHAYMIRQGEAMGMI